MKKKTIYEKDGLKFNSKTLLDFYIYIKNSKVVSSFELPTLEKQNAKSKFGAKKCIINGFSFDSIMEARFYVYLKELILSGEVKDIILQPVFVLQKSFKKNGKTIREIKYISDFLVTYNDGSVKVYDVKGRETPDFKLKKKMFDYMYRDLELVCIQYQVKKGWVDIHNKK